MSLNKIDSKGKMLPVDAKAFVEMDITCPPGEDVQEWIASNTIKFYIDLALVYESVVDEAKQKYPAAGDGFPPGYQYLWIENNEEEGKSEKVSGPEYIEKALKWIDKSFDDKTMYPRSRKEEFAADFQDETYQTLVIMFRIFAILLFFDFGKISQEIQVILNTQFKHFIFFCNHFNLMVDNEEVGPLRDLVTKISLEYKKIMKKRRETAKAEKKQSAAGEQLRVPRPPKKKKKHVSAANKGVYFREIDV